MTGFIFVAAIASGAYQFTPATKLDYDVNVVFDGFLPLMGGNEGVADVKFGVQVNGLEPKDGGLRSTIELTAFELSFNGGKIPMLDVESARAYFPKAEVLSTAQGKVLKNSAPEVSLPVRLPGLDVRRFPDITYLPVEFDPKGLEVGSTWSFDRMFGDTPMHYECVAVKETGGTLTEISVKVSQDYEVLEDETLEIVPELKGATSRVKTTLRGTGTVLFDTKRGAAVKVDMANSSTSVVTDIKSGKQSTRKLDSKLSVKLKGFEMPGAGSAAAPATGPTTPIQTVAGWFQGAWNAGQDLWNQGVGYATLARMAMGVFLSQIPGGGQFFRFLFGG
ncbi:MAG: hypothetical protein JNM28_04175 [Armatimonadetes bacterium]|nr:hypothetical protein [Armatimonadota bacterium]MBS1710298.1 hypothetical protein [Armatimonadota bacterium]MBX3109065.1 hypothetical protein [Fimbriimonadaceae bacterium]